VIDPLRHLHPYLDLARGIGLTIETVIDTHGHADHISGGVALAAKTGASYYLHPYDGIHPIDVPPATIPYEFIRDSQKFPVGRYELQAVHIPGHTLGLVAFRIEDKYLFTGRAGRGLGRGLLCGLLRWLKRSTTDPGAYRRPRLR
jgi:glyoxylase-like metal-dependent hydrolase (beta-lactamase superfamily II)